jgi:Sec-independent protein translocase protein TatA
MCLPIVSPLGFLPIWTPGGSEMLLLAVLALLLYGGELPKVARSWGRAFGEFRRHLAGIQRDLNQAIYSEPERLEYRPTEPATGEAASAAGSPETTALERD